MSSDIATTFSSDLEEKKSSIFVIVFPQLDAICTLFQLRPLSLLQSHFTFCDAIFVVVVVVLNFWMKKKKLPFIYIAYIFSKIVHAK